MTKNLFRAFLLAGLSLPPLALPLSIPAHAQSEGIVAVVNNDAITDYELASREKLMVASAALPDTPDTYQKLRPETLNTLIEERLMMQEGAKDDIKVAKDEIDSGFATVAKQNNWSADQFRQMMEQAGIPIDTLNSQIEAQITWGKVIQKEIRPDIEVTEAEVEATSSRLRSEEGKPQYLLADIFLPVNVPGDEAPARQLAAKLDAELQQGHAPFQRVAAQFSQAPGAAKSGGDLGWVQQGQLAPEIEAALAVMKEGQLSPPIRAHDGYHILLLRKTQTLTEQTLPSVDNIREKIGVDKLNHGQQRLMQELKSSAFIEKR